MRNQAWIDSPVGRLTLTEEDGALVELFFGEREGVGLATALLEEAARQLDEYFSGVRRAFELPLRPAGTSFQQAVWRALMEIPYGETRSYRDIAQAIDNRKAFRAVGMANHLNRLPIVIPCHRVIGADGSPGGYAGGADRKRFLLELERENRRK